MQHALVTVPDDNMYSMAHTICMRGKHLKHIRKKKGQDKNAEIDF